MAQIIEFAAVRNKKQEAHKTALTVADKKVRLIDYFREEFVGKVHLIPADGNCRYEKILLDICDVFLEAAPTEKAQLVAEIIQGSDVKGLSLSGFIDKLSSDDLLYGCVVSEVAALSRLDKLFLLNVLSGKFLLDKAIFNVLKLVLFSDSVMLEANKFQA